jgi:hypothetical protein
LAEFTIDVKRLGFILLPVEFDGKECLFLFDTGCTCQLVDVSFRSKLGRPRKRVEVLAKGKAITADLFDAPEALLGPLNLKESGFFGCVDLEVVSQSIGRQIHGIIGMSFLKHYIVQIDFDNERLSFLQPKKGAKHNWGIELPITYGRYEVPLTKVSILEKVDTYSTIDTGLSDTGFLDSAIVKYILLLQDIKTVGDGYITVAGLRTTRSLRIDSFSLGPFEYKNQVFLEANGSSLGLLFLSRHKVTFDFPNSRIYLKKGKEFNRVDELGMAGLACLRVAGQTVVQEVFEGDPSHKAGIKAGDIILDIMGKAADSYEMREIGQLLRSGDKRKIEMTIKRGDETMRVTIVLHKRI